MQRQRITMEEAVTQLSTVSRSIDRAADELATTTSPDASLIEKVFKQMVKIERQLWQAKADLEGLADDPEIDYRLRAILSSSRPSHTNLPYILSGLRTLAQLSNDELSKSNQERNVLLERLRESMNSIGHELRSINGLLREQIG